MSPAWARHGAWRLYFYAAEPLQVPHVQVRGGGFRATVRIVDGQVLAGRLPPNVLREVQDLLSQHRTLATTAFRATLDHAFPGTLEQMLDQAQDERGAIDEQ